MANIKRSKSSYWTCDHCQRVLKHGELRFNCIVCPNYDLCESCMTTISPPHPHRMIRDLAYGDEETTGLDEFCIIRMASGIQLATAMYSDRYCLGIRDVDKSDSSSYADTYSWLTYRTVYERSKNFAHGLRSIIEPRDYLAICAANRPEWVITDFACILQSIISVPMYCLFNDRELTYIINNTKVTVVVCDKRMLSRFIHLSTECPSLRHLVCMDPISELLSELQTDALSIHYMGDIETRGMITQYDPIPTTIDQCLTIIYTSGSSGFPKGAVVSEMTFIHSIPDWCAPSVGDLINFCYEPLAWVSDRDGIFRTFWRGGRTGFSTGDTSRLMEELALVRPNGFSTTPAIWNKIYAEFKAALSLAADHLPPDARAKEEDRLLEQFSKLLPRRCKAITVGGAMISPTVLDFIRRCFVNCTIYESYGITECGGITSDNIIDTKLPYRLIPVPEMGYTADGDKLSRGELVIKTGELFTGYINNPEETQAAFTEDGYFRTGDIVEQSIGLFRRVSLRVIDRKKNFFKLSQGQFVSPEFLQGIYIQSPFVEQIYIHGDLMADSVAAVVVPNREYAHAFACEHHIENFDMNNPDPKFYFAVLRDLQCIGEKESLRKHEIPSRLLLDFEQFTPENGLLTSTMKPCRHKLAAHYGERLKECPTIEQQLKKIIEATTGQHLTTDNQDHTFVPTGGDSFTAVRLSRTIENDLGISVPLHLLLRPDITLEQLTMAIKDPSHISPMSQSDLSQLLKDAQIDLDIVVGKQKDTVSSPSNIFVTGTTGFVGAFLLAELLLVYPSECKFICLVRCDIKTNPLERIQNNMIFYKIWKEDFQNRIIPVRGDLSKVRFGFDTETYESLANQIDLIYHCGAIVNFVMPYSRLYDANIGGTREIIRLAAYKSTCIPIHYISTISVLSSDVNTEVSIDKISPEKLSGGYAQSKWVAEKLMNRASQLGLPIAIYRLGSICASVKTGACNRNDFYTLILAAIMKICSFPETLIKARLYGLPADFTAKSIVYLSRNQSDANGKIYHVANSDHELLFTDIIEIMHRLGIDLKGITLAKWQTELKTISNEDSLIESVAQLFNEHSFNDQCQISTNEYYQSISALEMPKFDKIYLQQWLDFILQNIVRSKGTTDKL